MERKINEFAVYIIATFAILSSEQEHRVVMSCDVDGEDIDVVIDGNLLVRLICDSVASHEACVVIIPSHALALIKSAHGIIYGAPVLSVNARDMICPITIRYASNVDHVDVKYL